MPPAGSVAIAQSKLLLVEGKDEVNFFSAAIGHHLKLGGLQVIDYSGKVKLSTFLRTLVADPAFASVTGIGITRDADQTPAGAVVSAADSAFDAVRGALTAATIHLPCPAGHGLFAAGPPRIGVYIMPDGVSDGMLETLCTNAVAADPAFACVTDFFACCATAGAVPNNLHKARALVWLASRPQPDKRIGEAALAGYWPFGEPVFSPLWDFLRAI